jgi:LEA14-like dessication related protein
MRKYLWIPALLVGGYFIWDYSNKLGQVATGLVATPSNLSVKGTIFNPKLVLTFQINNPSELPLTITKIFGTIVNNGNQIATFSNEGNTIIAPTGLSNLDVLINIDIVSLGSQILKGQLKNSFVIDGTVFSGLIQVSFTKTLSIDGY